MYAVMLLPEYVTAYTQVKKQHLYCFDESGMTIQLFPVGLLLPGLKTLHVLDGKCLCVQSDGIGHTRYLAEQHLREAVRQIQQLEPSVERDALISATQRVSNRLK